MKLILKSAVPHLGEPGDVVDVKAGYARNYLIPKGLGIEATKANLKSIEHQLHKLRAQAEQKRSRAREIAAEFEDITLEFERKVVDPEEGNLYGSVTVADIGDALEERGFDIDRGEIHLEQPFREIGEYEVTMTLAHGVDGAVKVQITPEGGPIEEPPEEVAAPEVVEEVAAAAEAESEEAEPEEAEPEEAAEEESSGEEE